MKKKFTKITVDLETKKKVEEIASSENRSQAKQIKHWAENHCVNKNPLPEATLNRGGENGA